MEFGHIKINKIQADILELLSYSYIYIPIVLFLVYWIKGVISIVVLLFLFVTVFFHVVEGSSKRIKFLVSGLGIYVVVFAIAMLWCVMSGLGGYTSQMSDWSKHNILLKTLVENDWPVTIEWRGRTGVISYYIAGYLVPAGIGKIFGMEAAQQMILLWGAAGICLTILNVCKNMPGVFWKYTPLIVCFGMILFSTFNAPLTGIYRSWNAEDAADGVYYMSQSVLIQYTSQINNLRWVFPQFISASLTASLLLGKRKNYDVWGLICIPCLLYSAFCFAGIVLILLSVLVVDFAKERKSITWKKILDKKNICLLPLLLVVLIYLGANVIQKKPDTAYMEFKLIDYSGNKMLFILFELSWILWILLLARQRSNFCGNWVIPSSVCLFALPFFSYGRWNDLCMRGSIPALSFICFYVIKEMIDSMQKKGIRWNAGLIATCLAISGMASACSSFQSIVSAGFGKDSRYDPFGNISEFFDAGDYIPYQYVCYETDGIIKYIMKNEIGE